MIIEKPLQENKLKANKFLKLVLSLQLIVISIFFLRFIGVDIPLLGNLIVFVYVTFIPGTLILRIIKLNCINYTEIVLYSLGLSLSFLMLLGLTLNILSQTLNFPKPITSFNVILLLNITIITLIFISYFKEKNSYNNYFPKISSYNNLIDNKLFFLMIIPFLAIIGTYIMNFYQINIVLIITIISIPIIVLLAIYEKIPPKLYPFTIFIISISLLYHSWLISMYIWGTDIHGEFYYANQTIINSYWNWLVPTNTNAMLSITILAPLYQIIVDSNLTWIFKIIYPFIFSMVPLGLYEIFRKQTTSKTAFLACFFFVSAFFYVTWLIPLKQQLAELFLVLILLLIVNYNINDKKRSFLLVIFGFTMVVSHYGTSYIFLFSLISSWLLLLVLIKKDGFYYNTNKHKIINPTLIVLFIVFLFTWYMYVSNSNALKTIFGIFNNIFGNVIVDFLSSDSTEGLRYVTYAPQTFLGFIQKGLYILTSFFIMIGVLDVIRGNRFKFRREYLSFSVIFLFICFACISLPYFSKAMETQRLYHLTLILLSPFCIIGGIKILKLLKLIKIKISIDNAYKLLACFLIIFFFINVGFVDELAGTNRLDSIPFSLDSNKTQINVYEPDIYGGSWLRTYKNDQFTIYTDLISRSSLVSYSGIDWKKDILVISIPPDNIKGSKYVFLSKKNVIDGLMITRDFIKHNKSEINPFINNNSIIYSNGGNEIIFHN